MLVMCGCFYFIFLYNTSIEKTHTINTLEELALFAEQFLAEISKSEVSGAVVVGISGDLGAGKTTFVQILAKLLGVTDVVTRPTFTIMKGYETAPGAVSYPFIIVKVGLVTTSVTPRSLARIWTKVVLPAPRSPDIPTTTAPETSDLEISAKNCSAKRASSSKVFIVCVFSIDVLYRNIK